MEKSWAWAILAACCGHVGLAGEALAAPFDFVALGDTAYNVPGDYPAYEALIRTINASKPAFSVHVGDIFGVAPCTEALYKTHVDYFDRFSRPLIYTPGDNEWVDCHFSEPALRDATRGTFDTAAFVAGKGADIGVERLRGLRRTFFPTARSLGAETIPLTRQGDGAAFPDVVENARWTHGGVLFSTFHVPGTHNGLSTTSELASAEMIGRNRANLAWLEDAFATAKSQKLPAIVLFLHADIFEMVHAEPPQFGTSISSHVLKGGSQGPFYWFALRLVQLAEAYDGQILLVHGDGHRFIIDRPMTIFRGEKEPPLRPNITRLQVYGAPEIRAVRVTVDTDTPWVFSFSPLYNRQ